MTQVMNNKSYTSFTHVKLRYSLAANLSKTILEKQNLCMEAMQ